MQKFFIDGTQVSQKNIIVSGDEGFHIVKSLRMRIGEAICFCDSESVVYECEIESIEAKTCTVVATIKEQYLGDTETVCDVTLFMCLTKSDKMDWIVQKCVELGVRAIVPVVSENCVAKLNAASAEKKVQRWNKIAMEAAKQSGRCKIPVVEDPLEFEKVFERVKSLEDEMDLLMPYENEQHLTLKGALQSKLGKKPVRIACLIGPEGGFTDDETEYAREHGAKTVTLGKRILRAETAAIAVVANIVYELDMIE